MDYGINADGFGQLLVILAWQRIFIDDSVAKCNISTGWCIKKRKRNIHYE